MALRTYALNAGTRLRAAAPAGQVAGYPVSALSAGLQSVTGILPPGSGPRCSARDGCRERGHSPQ